jgi:hypothetical protein
MILCIEIVVSYIISYDMEVLDIVTRYNRLGIALLPIAELPHFIWVGCRLMGMVPPSVSQRRLPWCGRPRGGCLGCSILMCRYPASPALHKVELGMHEWFL